MRDFEYFKSLYPREAKRLQLFVEATVDEVDYEGSPIYDEYPDRLFLEQLTNQAAERAGAEKRFKSRETEKTGSESSEEPAGNRIEVIEIEGNGYRMWEPTASVKQEMQAQERRNRPPQNRPPQNRPPQGPPPWGSPSSPGPQGPPPPPEPWDFLNVLLMHELLQRRFLKKS